MPTVEVRREIVAIRRTAPRWRTAARSDRGL